MDEMEEKRGEEKRERGGASRLQGGAAIPSGPQIPRRRWETEINGLAHLRLPSEGVVKQLFLRQDGIMEPCCVLCAGGPGTLGPCWKNHPPNSIPDNSLKFLIVCREQIREKRRAVPPGSLQDVEDQDEGDCRSMPRFLRAGFLTERMDLAVLCQENRSKARLTGCVCVCVLMTEHHILVRDSPFADNRIIKCRQRETSSRAYIHIPVRAQRLGGEIF